MTGQGTLRLRARFQDVVENKLRDYGQDVTIFRPGRDDVTTRAFLYQLDDKTASAEASKPEFREMAWQGVFKPDAPVGSGHFVVRDAQGRLFVPDSDPQDGGTQGVAWFVHLLPAPERVRVDQLTFSTPGVSAKDPRTGNIVTQPGTPLPPVPARLVASTDPRVRDMAGADAAAVVLVGRWGTLLHPLLKPDGVAWGSTSPLLLDGRPGVLTVQLAYPDADLVREQHLGARFIGVWRAT